ncbi:MAG TPA: hypothetical protein VFI91_07200 [Longimicrobiaceae bacterium]|nr:hypothetical protein [Longimicrobiaceae bacterium]
MIRLTRVSLQFRRSTRCFGWIVLLAPVLVYNQAAAQTHPVEFNHGFFNQGTAWDPTADYLRQRLQIETLTPTTPWDRPFNEQSAALHDALNSWGRTSVIGIAHSNGGIVARNSVRLYGGANRLDRLATIGTPHRGATIATNVLNGRVVRYFGGLAGSVGAAVDFYANNDPDWSVAPVVDFVTQNAFEWICYLGWYFANNSRFAGLGFGAAMPVIYDDQPSSAFMADLNSSGALSAESSVLYRRVGIATQVPPNGAFFRLVSSDPSGWRTVQAITAYGALALYHHFRNHPDWWLASHANYWLQVYWYTTLLDVAWHDFIGALQGWNGYYAIVYPSDGFIPDWSSKYPGANSQYNLYLPYHNISHTEQKDHPDARNQFENVLRYDFGVPVRTTTDPGGGDTTCDPSSTKLVCPY